MIRCSNPTRSIEHESWDVVIVDFPFSSGSVGTVRPALVIQSDSENQRLTKTIIAMITGNLQRSSQATHFLIDPSTSDGATSGLHGPSLVSCINLFTLEQQDILRKIGQLSKPSMNQIDQCLRVALEL